MKNQPGTMKNHSQVKNSYEKCLFNNHFCDRQLLLYINHYQVEGQVAHHRVEDAKEARVGRRHRPEALQEVAGGTRRTLKNLETLENRENHPPKNSTLPPPPRYRDGCSPLPTTFLQSRPPAGTGREHLRR